MLTVRSSFQVKCGGHATSPGISSVGEPGIQIHLARLQTITNYRGTQTVDIGAGCTWDQVYNALNPWQLGVVGGSASEGVGEHEPFTTSKFVTENFTPY